MGITRLYVSAATSCYRVTGYYGACNDKLTSRWLCVSPCLSYRRRAVPNNQP